jgi:hypothetical protein
MHEHPHQTHIQLGVPQQLFNVRYGVEMAPAAAIFIATFTTKIDPAEAGIDLRNIIDVNSGQRWNTALHNPAASVDWIIEQPEIAGSLDDSPDLIAQQIKLRNPAFLSQFTLIVQESSGIRLYYRQAARSLQTRTLASDTQFTGRQCSAVKGS